MCSVLRPWAHAWLHADSQCALLGVRDVWARAGKRCVCSSAPLRRAEDRKVDQQDLAPCGRHIAPQQRARQALCACRRRQDAGVTGRQALNQGGSPGSGGRAWVAHGRSLGGCQPGRAACAAAAPGAEKGSTSGHEHTYKGPWQCRHTVRRCQSCSKTLQSASQLSICLTPT